MFDNRTTVNEKNINICQTPAGKVVYFANESPFNQSQICSHDLVV